MFLKTCNVNSVLTQLTKLAQRPFLRAKAGTAVVRLSHRNSVCPFV